MHGRWETVAAIALAALYGTIAWTGLRGLVASGLGRLRRLPRPAALALAVCAAVAAVVGDKVDTNGTDRAGAPRRAARIRGGGAALATNDVERGYRVLARFVDAAAELPTNAVTIGNWHVRGAASPFGANRAEVPGFPFPFGRDALASAASWILNDGRIRPTPRDAAREIDTGIGPVAAIPGVSRLAASEGEDGGVTVWWWRFCRLPDTNTPVTAAVTFYPDGLFALRTNDVVEVCEPVRPREWLSISAPSVIMRNGWTNIVSATLNTPFAVDAEPELQCVEGAERLSIDAVDARTLAVRGVACSETPGDVKFAASVTVCGETFAATQSVTVARVAALSMSSDCSEICDNSPPFDGESASPFDPTRSPGVDRHLLIPFAYTLDPETLDPDDFTVRMRLMLEPDVEPDFASEWRVAENTAESGSLAQTGTLSAEFRNPVRGGVIRIAVSCGGSPETEGTILLPLAGASVDEVFEHDFENAMVAVSYFSESWPRYLLTPFWGWYYFYHKGDYHGRVDSATRRTVRHYNQIDDGGEYFGAVATLNGMPIRIAKLSNFLVSYTTASLGVNEMMRQASRMLGTDDDLSAAISWNAGAEVAANGNFDAVTAFMATNAFRFGDMKVHFLWPNDAPADNHLPSRLISDFNENFCSPPFIEKFIEMEEDD